MTEEARHASDKTSDQSASGPRTWPELAEEFRLDWVRSSAIEDMARDSVSRLDDVLQNERLSATAKATIWRVVKDIVEAVNMEAPRAHSRILAALKKGAGERRIWLWRNGTHEFVAYDNPFPTLDGGDPLTLGEPAGWAYLCPSTDGRPGYPVEQVEQAVARCASRALKDSEAADTNGGDEASALVEDIAVLQKHGALSDALANRLPEEARNAWYHLTSMYSHRGDGIPTQHTYPPEARDAAKALVIAALTAHADEIARLSASNRLMGNVIDYACGHISDSSDAMDFLDAYRSDEHENDAGFVRYQQAQLPKALKDTDNG